MAKQKHYMLGNTPCTSSPVVANMDIAYCSIQLHRKGYAFTEITPARKLKSEPCSARFYIFEKGEKQVRVQEIVAGKYLHENWKYLVYADYKKHHPNNSFYAAWDRNRLMEIIDKEVA